MYLQPGDVSVNMDDGNESLISREVPNDDPNMKMVSVAGSEYSHSMNPTPYRDENSNLRASKLSKNNLNLLDQQINYCL